jgi:hypothetical protein
MKTQLGQVKLYLEREVRARERKNRYKAIRHLLLNKYPSIISQHLTNDRLEDIIFDSLAFNRSILRIQQEYEHLRGTDYNQKDSKKILEQKTKIDLGYNPGHRQDVSKLKTLL